MGKTESLPPLKCPKKKGHKGVCAYGKHIKNRICFECLTPAQQVERLKQEEKDKKKKK